MDYIISDCEREIGTEIGKRIATKKVVFEDDEYFWLHLVQDDCYEIFDMAGQRRFEAYETPQKAAERLKRAKKEEEEGDKHPSDIWSV